MKNIFTIVLLISFFAIVSCDRDKNNPGYDYFPDMAYTKAYETYAPNPNFADGKTLQMPVAGTIARDAENYPYKKVDEDIPKAAKLKNPFLPDTQNISRGKLVYNIVCLQCHGEKADGSGHLFLSGKYPYPPADLVHGRIDLKKDGELYHTITVGFGIMGAHGLIVQPDDRWKIVLYLRNLAKKTNKSENPN